MTFFNDASDRPLLPEAYATYPYMYIHTEPQIPQTRYDVDRRLIDLQNIPCLCMYVCIRSIDNTETMTRVQTKHTQEFQML